MLPKPFLLALAYRSISLLFPQTYFQPDEYWQALEPAHRHVFGYGHLTWEWRDLPDGGRLRGWLWPSVFVLIYRFLQLTGLDDTRLLVLMPRMVGVVVAAVTDWATYRLSSKLMGPGSAAGAFFLSTTNIFNAHALTRSLSNSPETMLTTLALVHFPLLSPEAPKTVLAGDASSVDPVVRSPGKTSINGTKRARQRKGQDIQITRVDKVEELNYVVMDRAGPDLEEHRPARESLTLAVFFASVAICIRPTTLTFWAYLGMDHLVRLRGTRDPVGLVRDLLKAGLTGLAVLGCSTLIDYHFTGKLYLPLWSFTKVNMTISAFFGATSPLYHLTQSLPIILFPIWYWWGQGFMACILPKRYIPQSLQSLDHPEGMRSLARAITFAIFTLSLSPHSEWRFLHPFLPSLLLFALPPLFRQYVPAITGAYRFRDSLRQYTRIPKRAFYLIMLAPIIPYLCMNIYHQWAQIEVMNVLRRGDVGDVKGLAMVTSCHSMPWMSHLHRDVPNWWLTCEPPLDKSIDRATYKQESQLFYEAPLSSFLSHMESYAANYGHTGDSRPSHVVSFGATTDMGETETSTTRPTIKDALRDMGYRLVWYGWSPFDRFNPDKENRGGVEVWTTDTTVEHVA